jgi:tetratricopeptide (TPR) repeat protein
MRDRLRPSVPEPGVSNAAATRESRPSRRFGRFELQPAERRLLADGQPVALGARAFDLLVVLVERAGRLVAKNDLLTLVWPGLVVEEFRRESFDAALRAADLYRSLGDDSRRYDALLCAALQIRFASTLEVEQAVAEATRLERPDWPVGQRAMLQRARCWWYARLGRFEEALVCAQRHSAMRREGGHLLDEQYAMANVALIELLLGRLEAALEHGRAAIAQIDALGAGGTVGHGRGHLYWAVMIALILLSRPAEAVAAGRMALTNLLPEGDECQLLAALALLAALQGRLAAAARIIGRDDAVAARTAKVVRPVSVLLRARLEPLLAGLRADELARLRGEGAAMRDDRVFKLGFGDDV